MNNGRVLDYSRGLFIDSNRGGKFYWHTGSAEGYKSLLARYPTQGLSIGIMCNSGDDTNRMLFARRIFDLFVPTTAAAPDREVPPAAVAGVDASGLDLSGRAGLYFSERTGEPLQLVVQRGRLRVAGGPPLVATSGDSFRRWRASLRFMSQDEFELHFLSPARFELRSMEGEAVRFRRARPYAPGREELEGFGGRYKNDEIGTVFVIEPKGDGLVMRLDHAPAKSLRFRPVDRDTFQWRRMTVRFDRCDDGTVVGFEYSNPMLRSLRFLRVGGR